MSILGSYESWLEEDDDENLVNPITGKPVTRLFQQLWKDFENNSEIIGYSKAQIVHLLLTYDASLRGKNVNLVGLIKESSAGVSSYWQNKEIQARIKRLEGSQNQDGLVLEAEGFLEIEEGKK